MYTVTVPSADKIRDRAKNSASRGKKEGKRYALLESAFFALSIKVSVGFHLAIFAAFYAPSRILSADGSIFAKKNSNYSALAKRGVLMPN